MSTFKLRAELHLTPLWHSEPPLIEVWIDDAMLFSGEITGARCFALNNDFEQGPHSLRVMFKNKKDSDTIVATGQDKAVLISKVVFNDISSERFIWESEYTPIYPEPWASEQGSNLQPVLKSSNYLGWNGEWKLNFDVPIFTWIHKVENLGWIFD